MPKELLWKLIAALVWTLLHHLIAGWYWIKHVKHYERRRFAKTVEEFKRSAARSGRVSVAKHLAYLQQEIASGREP